MTIFLFQGKFIRINFDTSGFISGANIESCILSGFYVSLNPDSRALSKRQYWQSRRLLRIELYSI